MFWLAKENNQKAGSKKLPKVSNFESVSCQSIVQEMSDKFEKAIRIEPFSGKQEDWQVWSEQFLAQARRKGFKDILKGKVAVPTDDELGASNLSADEAKKLK